MTNLVRLGALGFLVLVGCAPAPAPTGSAGSPPPTSFEVDLPPDVMDDLAGVVMAVMDPSPDGASEWLVADADGPWIRSGFPREAVLRTDNGQLVATYREGTDIVVDRVDPRSAVRDRIHVVSGAWTGTNLAALSPDGATLVIFGADGLRVVDLASGREDRFIPKEPQEAGPTQRGDIEWSPTGAVVVSPECDQETCHVDVVSIDSGEVQVVESFVPSAASDRFLIGYRSEADRAWAVVDLETLDVRTLATESTRPYDAVALSDGRFLLYGTAPARPGVIWEAVDVLDGRHEVLDIDLIGDRRIFARLPESGWILLSSESGLFGDVREGSPLDLVDTSEGTVLLRAFPLPSLIVDP